jgi:hypothetical protein
MAGGEGVLMLDRHVSDQLAAYLDGEVSVSGRARVESHVAHCERCRHELEQIRVSTTALQLLPVVSAPPGLWEAIDSASAARAVRTTTPWITWRWAAAALFVAIAGLWMWLRPGASWEVIALDGSPVAGSRRLSGSHAVATGQWVETDAHSRARITIGAIGAVQVEPNTSVRLVSTDPKGHRLALRNGEIIASISAPPRLFFVDTPAGTAIDLGCEYRLHCNRAGTGMLRVSAGWVALQWQRRESLVPAGASCRLYAGSGPGTPWFDDAARTFVQAVQSFDSGSRVDLAVILAEARARDSLTLWHLLARTGAEDRVRLYDRMAELAPPPSTVSRERVLQLDSESLNRWREELAWIW